MKIAKAISGTVGALLLLASCSSPFSTDTTARLVSINTPELWQVGDVLNDGLSQRASIAGAVFSNAVFDTFSDGDSMNTDTSRLSSPSTPNIPWLRTNGGAVTSVSDDGGNGTHHSSVMVVDSGQNNRPIAGTLYDVNSGGSPEYSSESPVEAVSLGVEKNAWIRFRFDFRLDEAVNGQLKFGLLSSEGTELDADNDKTNGDDDTGFIVSLPLSKSNAQQSGTASIGTRNGVNGSTFFEGVNEIDSNTSAATIRDTKVHQAWLWFRRVKSGTDGAVTAYLVLDKKVVLVTKNISLTSFDEIVFGIDEVFSQAGNSQQTHKDKPPIMFIDDVRLYATGLY